MQKPHHSPERRNTPEENDRCTRILEAMAVAAWLVAVYHLAAFTLRAFAPLFR